MTPALGRKGQVDFCEFEARLFYVTNFRRTKATW